MFKFAKTYKMCEYLQNVTRTLFGLPMYPECRDQVKRSSLMNGYHPLSFKVQYCRVALAMKWLGGKILLFSFFSFFFCFSFFFYFFFAFLFL